MFIYEIVRWFNIIFVMLIDCEDIYVMVSWLDDVFDFIDEVVDWFFVYKIDSSIDGVIVMVKIIVKMVEEIDCVVCCLRMLLFFYYKYVVEVNWFENEVDCLFRD